MTNPSTPSPKADWWHRMLAGIGSIADRVFKYAPAAQAVTDVALTATGNGLVVPAANAIFAGVGELHEAAEKWMLANPNQHLTTEAITSTLLSTRGLAGSTLSAIAQNVQVLSPTVAAKMAAAGAQVTAATGVAAQVAASLP